MTGQHGRRGQAEARGIVAKIRAGQSWYENIDWQIVCEIKRSKQIITVFTD